ncbi:MAG TPA: transmembrane domain-containing protein [Candidatus Paceibacterota bacterium]
MPPEFPAPVNPKDHLLPPHQKPAGPIIATIIILVLLIVGAVYFWYSHQKKQKDMLEQVSYIPSGTTTMIIKEE